MAEKIPAHLEPVRERCHAALGKVRPADKASKASKDFLFTAQRTEAGRKLPRPYLIYFVLVDLLGFKDLGHFEKVAWSVPVDYDGDAFLIEHRKFGCGVFAADLPAQEEQAKQIVKLLTKAVKLAEPYFEWKASQAMAASQLNVMNHSMALFERYEYFLKLYQEKVAEALARKDEVEVTKHVNGATYHFPAWGLQRDAKWLALATIKSFFSWTEHIFIHIAILKGRATTGAEVAKLAESEWADKFKTALSLDEPETKRLFDKLIFIRRQLRNSVAHGAFGKKGEAFQFHSSAGAVPVVLPHQSMKEPFRFGDGVGFVDAEAIKTLQEFVDHLWTGEQEPAKRYVHQSSLPLVLTMAGDGTYTEAMQSVQRMSELVDHLNRRFDDAANMDW